MNGVKSIRKCIYPRYMKNVLLYSNKVNVLRYIPPLGYIAIDENNIAILILIYDAKAPPPPRIKT